MIRTSEVRAADFLMRFDAALFEQGCTDMEFRTKLVLSVAPIVMKMAMNGVIKLCRFLLPSITRLMLPGCLSS